LQGQAAPERRMAPLVERQVVGVEEESEHAGSSPSWAKPSSTSWR
jgi:hypothetical protein